MNNKKIGIVFLIALFLITQVYAFELTTKDTIKDVCPSTTTLYTATVSGQGNFNINYGGSAAAFATVVPQGFSLNNEIRTIIKIGFANFPIFFFKFNVVFKSIFNVSRLRLFMPMISTLFGSFFRSASSCISTKHSMLQRFAAIIIFFILVFVKILAINKTASAP